MRNQKVTIYDRVKIEDTNFIFYNNIGIINKDTMAFSDTVLIEDSICIFYRLYIRIK
jgi:hypothetical protein